MPGPRNRLIEDAIVHARMASRPVLDEAWGRVWRNGGAGGGDGVGIQSFASGVHQKLALLSNDLKTGDYEPGPIRRVMIPKKSGGQRPLDIPCIRDRVAQTALSLVLGPQLDEEFETSSFAYRPGRSVAEAVRRVSFLRGQGFSHVVDADITRFFERVPHDALLQRLAESMTEGAATALISLWLEHAAPSGRGLAQGSPLSPLLANLYLDRLDEAFADAGARILRYADDFLILCRSEKGAEAALGRVEALLARQGLELNREKTRVRSFDAGFRFLGHAFVRSFVLEDPDGAMEGAGEADLKLVARQDELDRLEVEREERTEATRRRAGLDPGQRVLYVTSAGRRLDVRNAGFVVRESLLGEDAKGEPRGDAWRDVMTFHPADLDRIEIWAGAEAGQEALLHALGSGTELCFVNGHGETRGWVTQGADRRAGRQAAQARAMVDPARRLALARVFVDGRMRNQRALLRRLNRAKADAGVVKAIATINQLIRRLPALEAIDALMGMEGRATAAYWPAFGRLLDHGFAFRTREREKPADPVNIMLNMTASLLARDVTVAVLRAGLHPGFGFLHEAGDHRDALVYDVMELFRGPLAEAVVSGAINQRVVARSMFAPRPGGEGARLLPPARDALIRAYQRYATREVADPVSGRRRTWRAILSDRAIALARSIETGAVFAPPALDY